MHRIVEVVPQGISYAPSDVPTATKEQWEKAQKLAALVMARLPPHVTHREAQINLPTYEGGPAFVGYIDLGIKPGLGWAQLMIPADPSIGIIGDLKTTSDFKYIKTPAELADSVQMMSYAKWALQTPGLVRWDETPPSTIYLAHVYALTKDPITQKNVRESVACVTADQVEAKWDNTLDKIRRMSKVALSADHNQVDATGALTGHCQAYGGCSFRDKCGLASDVTVGKLFQLGKKTENPVMSNPTPGAGSALMDRIKAAKAKIAAGEPATNVPATPQATAPAPATVVASPPPVAPATTVPTVVAQPATPAVAAAVIPSNVPTGVVPPEAPPRDQAPETIVPAGTPAPTVQHHPATTFAQATPQATPQPVGNPVDTTGPKRGRPTKAEMDAKKAAEDAILNAEVDKRVAAKLVELGAGIAQAPVTISDAEIAAVISDMETQIATLTKEQGQLYSIRDRLLATTKDLEAQAKAGGVEPEGLTLYVDCLPVKGATNVVDYYDWVAPISARAAELGEVPDWRVVNYTSRGVFAIAMREWIKANGMPKGAMIIRSNVSGSDVAMEILTPLAKRVVNAYR